MRLKTILICALFLFNISVNGQTTKQKFATAIAQSDTPEQVEIANLLANQYSSFTYTYYGLMLTNLPRNATLITNSTDDTYPLTILQLRSKLRPDVKIISLGMLKDSLYQSKVNKTYSLALNGGSDNEIVSQITKSAKNVHISTTVKSNIWFKPSYYLEGLTVKIGGERQIRNLTAFYINFKNLKIKSSSINGVDLSLLKNILPPLITLYKSGENIEGLKKDILILAKLIGESEAIQKIIAAE